MRSRLVKGSPQAKAYMAKLRKLAVSKRKRGREAQLSYFKKAQASGDHPMGGHRSLGFNPLTRSETIEVEHEARRKRIVGEQLDGVSRGYNIGLSDGMKHVMNKYGTYSRRNPVDYQDVFTAAQKVGYSVKDAAGVATAFKKTGEIPTLVSAQLQHFGRKNPTDPSSTGFWIDPSNYKVRHAKLSEVKRTKGRLQWWGPYPTQESAEYERGQYLYKEFGYGENPRRKGQATGVACPACRDPFYMKLGPGKVRHYFCKKCGLKTKGGIWPSAEEIKSRRRALGNPHIVIDPADDRIVAIERGHPIQTFPRAHAKAKTAAQQAGRKMIVVAHPYVPKGFKKGVQVSKLFHHYGAVEVDAKGDTYSRNPRGRAANPQKLITAADLKRLPPIKGQESKGMEAIAWVKFFTPWTSWTWYMTEYDPATGEAFGLVHGLEEELGYFSMEELQSIRGPGGLRIERDIYWKPTPLSQIKGAARNPNSDDEGWTGYRGETCSICDGPLMPLGQLGRLMHYRCRNCGMQFSKDAKGSWTQAELNPRARCNPACNNPKHQHALVWQRAPGVTDVIKTFSRRSHAERGARILRSQGGKAGVATLRNPGRARRNTGQAATYENGYKLGLVYGKSGKKISYSDAQELALEAANANQIWFGTEAQADDFTKGFASGYVDAGTTVVDRRAKKNPLLQVVTLAGMNPGKYRTKFEGKTYTNWICPTRQAASTLVHFLRQRGGDTRLVEEGFMTTLSDATVKKLGRESKTFPEKGFIEYNPRRRNPLTRRESAQTLRMARHAIRTARRSSPLQRVSLVGTALGASEVVRRHGPAQAKRAATTFQARTLASRNPVPMPNVGKIPFRNGQRIPVEKAWAWVQKTGNKELIRQFKEAWELQKKANKNPKHVIWQTIDVGDPKRIEMVTAMAHYGDSPETYYTPPKGSKKGASQLYRHKWGEDGGGKKSVPLLAASSGKALIMPLDGKKVAGDWLRH